MLIRWQSEPEALATVIYIPSSGICLPSKPPEPRIFTAKTLRSSKHVWISCVPLRSLRLRGENVFMILFRVIPCSSVANASSLLTVADTPGSDPEIVPTLRRALALRSFPITPQAFYLMHSFPDDWFPSKFHNHPFHDA